MGLFSRPSGAQVTVSPAVVSPRDTVTATVTISKPMDKVTSASVEWGYTNFYRYHWAGRADSAAAAANDSLWLTGQVGTNYGGDRVTDEWVAVTKVDLPIATGEFAGGSSVFRVPSWAPGSSDEIAQWSCRLRVQRGGRDVDSHGDFTVVIGADYVEADQEPLEQVDGAAETVIDLTLSAPVYRAGDTIRGQITLTPTLDLPDGDLGVCWQRHRESHPLTRSPCPTSPVDGPIVKLGKHIPLRSGVPVVVPFEVPLPVDAAPSATAVHSSLSWFVQARLFYAGFTAHTTERVRRPIIVVNAP